MIGPAARKHFYKALQLTGEAEAHLHPGVPVGRVALPLFRAVIEMVRGCAFVMLSDEVEIKVREEKPK